MSARAGCFAVLGVLLLSSGAAADPPGFQPLESEPSFPPTTSYDFHDMTPDGRVVVGAEYYSPRPLRWTDGAVERLSFLPFPQNWAEPRAITPDGSLIVGGTNVSYYPDALAWRSAGLEILPRPDAPTPGAVANAVSDDGRIIVGTAQFPHEGRSRSRAVRW